jgi:acetyl esterase
MALFYGAFGTDTGTESYRSYGDGRFGLPRDRMAHFLDLHAPDAAARARLDVTRADLAGLPAAWLSAAGKDVLRDDARTMRAALEAAGVEVHWREDESLAHGYTVRARMVPLARAAIDEAAEFLRVQSRQASRLAAYAL